MRLPVYHEKGIKYDKEKFGEFLDGGKSPKVMIIDEAGVLIFQGIMDRAFDKALKAATSGKK
ncbi:MAG: hypothetical protein ACSHYB_04695 [Roseibacillus sp.]